MNMKQEIARMVRNLNDDQLCALVGPEILRRLEAMESAKVMPVVKAPFKRVWSKKLSQTVTELPTKRYFTHNDEEFVMWSRQGQIYIQDAKTKRSKLRPRIKVSDKSIALAMKKLYVTVRAAEAA